MCVLDRQMHGSLELSSEARTTDVGKQVALLLMIGSFRVQILVPSISII